MKGLVPAGTMASVSAGSITVAMCSGSGPQQMTMAIPGMDHDRPQKGDRGKAEMSCAFSVLTAASLGAADPLVMVLALAFVMAMVFRAAAPGAITTPAFLRPPLRGPPATA